MNGKMTSAFVIVLLAALTVLSARGDDTAPKDPRGMEHLAPFQALYDALYCFDNKTAVCPQGGYLDQTGKIPEFSKTDAELYCNGGCANQTLVQLKCIHDVYEPFRFNNKALVADIENTITAACDSNSDHFGNFTIEVTMSSGTNLTPVMTLIFILPALLFG